MKGGAAAVGKPKKPRAKRVKENAEKRGALHARYAHFGDAKADDSAEEERQMRAKLARVEDGGVALANTFEKDYFELFGKPPPIMAPAPEPPQLDFGPALMRAVDMTFFVRSATSTAHLKRDTNAFMSQMKELANKLYERMQALFAGSSPELSAFHDALCTEPELHAEPAPEGIAAKSWPDVCSGAASIPVNAGYCILNGRVAVPHRIAQMLAVCHAVYHVEGYISSAIQGARTPELNALVVGQPLPIVWSALCGGEPWATQTPVMQWKWPGATPFVQSFVQLRCVVQTAKAWI